MGDQEVEGVFAPDARRRLLVFTARVRRRDGHPLSGRSDLGRLLVKAATRKLPRALKYLPARYFVDPVVFATNLPEDLHSEFVRPLTRANYWYVMEASCLVPIAMGPPLTPGLVAGPGPLLPW